MRIFSVLPRPVSPLVNPPPGGVPTAAQTAHRTPGTPPEYTNTPTAKKRRTTPHRTPHSVHPNHSTNTPQTEPQHRTRATIQDYTLQQPGRSSRPQGSPNGDPQTAPQRAGTPPGCNGSPTDRSRPQRRTGGTGGTGGTEGNRKRPEPKPGALRLIYSFSTGQRRPRTEKLKYKVKSSFHPLIEP